MKGLLIALAAIAWPAAASAATDTYLDLCLPKVPEVVVQANASFPVIVVFAVDSSGHPTTVSVRKHKQPGWPPIDAEELIACVRTWRIGGLPRGATLSAKWQWKHGTGWEDLLIEGSGFWQRIVLHRSHSFLPPDRPSNLRLNPPHSAVTALAQSRKRRAVGRAG